MIRTLAALTNVRRVDTDRFVVSSKYGQELTALERSLVGHVERGTPLDLLGESAGPLDEAAMRSWGDDRTIRSWVIRDILLGRLAKDPDPHGIVLRGVRIAGRLDLMHVSSKIAIRFSHCLLPEGIDARFAQLGSIGLTDCRIEHPTLSAFNGQQLSAPILMLADTTIVGSSTAAALYLLAAQIGGILNLDGATLRNSGGPAFSGEAMQVKGSMFMRRSVAAGSGGRGAVRLFDTNVEGAAEFDGADLRNDTGPALNAEQVQVKGPLHLRYGFTATGSGRLGAVNLRRARLGALECPQATLRNASGPALTAYSAHVAGHVQLRDGFTAVAGADDAVYLYEARIDGPLDCSGGRFDSASGSGLNASRAQINGSMNCGSGFTATGSSPSGAVSVVEARIGNALECDGSVMRNNAGPALDAVGVDIKGVVLLREGFTAEGSGDGGAISFMGAGIGGIMEIHRATVRNDSGPALHASLLGIGGLLVVAGGTTLAGASRDGALLLIDARIDGGVEFKTAEVRNDSGPAVAMQQARVGQSVTFGSELRLVARSSHLAVNLAQVQIGSIFTMMPTCCERLKSSSAQIEVDGLTYAGLPQGISSAEWLELLRTATPRYAAQPYQHLAAAERAAGHDSGVRRVLMAQRRDQIESGALTGTGERLWADLSGVALGYGYQPWRALIALFLVLLMSALAAGFMGDRGGLQKVRTQANASAEACQLVDRIGFGLDAGAPLITSGARPKCETTSNAWGSALTISGWVLKVLAWAFATLFIAGFTGAVRKT